jgi:putative transport protein
MSEALRLLNEIPLAGLMLVVTLGFLLGRVSWRGISAGPAGGTLLVAVGLGLGGLDMKALYGGTEPTVTVGMFGFCLFIYSVGFEAGPRFFASFRGGPGWRFVAVSTVVNALSIAVALGCATLLQLDAALTAGALAGSLTSAPTYAAAAEALGEPGRLSISFAMTYPIGLVILVILIQLLPRWMGDDLLDDDDETGPADADHPAGRPELKRAFCVEKTTVTGTPLRELCLTQETGCFISRISRGDEIRVPDADTTLEAGDHLMVIGRLEQLQHFRGLVGPEVYDDDLRSRLPTPRTVIVTRGTVTGRTLADLDLIRRHRCLVTRITRGGIAIDPTAETALIRDDAVEVVGPRRGTHALAGELGRFETSRIRTDIAIYAGGILLGLVLGRLHLRAGGIDLSLGFAGGLLVMGLVLGRFRQIGPFSANVPPEARQLVRDLGILLFVAETGVRAGASPLGDMGGGQIAGILLTGLIVTVVPVVVAVLVARRLLHLRPVDAWGSVCGGMTSSAALSAVRNAADSNEPAVSYSAAFAVASVIMTMAGRLIVRLVT